MTGMDGKLAGVEIVEDEPELCPRFTARMFELDRDRAEPAMAEGSADGRRAAPDLERRRVTNYVMLLTGQPMHAFDLDRVAGGRLNVRRAKPREEVQTLDDQTRMLDEQMVVIEDDEGPTSIAGVMGGARSEVHEGTTTRAERGRDLGRRRTSTAPRSQLGLRSEASSRFEKRLQPEQAMAAQIVATKLIVEDCGATVGPARSTSAARPGAEHDLLRDRRLASLLGIEIPRERCRRDPAVARVHALPTRPTASGHVPAIRRADITREADLIEEVARIDGLERIPRRCRRRAATLLPRLRRRPKRRPACGRARRGGSRRASSCAAGRATCSIAQGCTRSWAGASPAPVAAACGCPRATPSCSTTRCQRAVAPAHDVDRLAARRRAAQSRRTARARWRCSRPAPST